MEDIIYMRIPAKWEDIYVRLLIALSGLGTDLLIECNASCKGENKEFLSCWNMFQVACALYQMYGETSEVKTLILFIKTKLNIQEAERTVGSFDKSFDKSFS